MDFPFALRIDFGTSILALDAGSGLREVLSYSLERRRATSSRRSQTMSKLDPYELEVLEAYEAGKLKPIAGKAELQRLRAAARATAIKDKRVNIRLSSVDLLDIQAKALEEGMPCQTLIASVLHKYVTGKLAESRPPAPGVKRRSTPRSG
jgi:predicted DNA binding CopG/RHH family protein